jgi:hypothetical protein
MEFELDRRSAFYKNCKKQRKNNAKTCSSCPFRSWIEEQEKRKLVVCKKASECTIQYCDHRKPHEVLREFNSLKNQIDVPCTVWEECGDMECRVRCEKVNK